MEVAERLRHGLEYTGVKFAGEIRIPGSSSLPSDYRCYRAYIVHASGRLLQTLGDYLIRNIA